MRKIIVYISLILFTIVFLGCGGGGGIFGGSSSSSSSANGGANKGPFKEGAMVTAYFLSEGVRVDDASHAKVTTETTDNKGTFTISVPWDGATEIVVEGDYFNETTGTYMSGGSLSAIVDMKNGEDTSINVNIFTHLAAQSIKKALRESTPVEEAKADAKEQIKKQFNLELNGDTELEDLDLTDGTTAETKSDNTQLLRVSAALMNTADPDKTINELADDLEDGTVDEGAVAVFDELKEEAKKIDVKEVATMMEEADIGVDEAPDSENNMDGKLAWDHNIKFDAVLDAFKNTPYASEEATVADIFGGTGTISISSGAEYSIDGGEFTSASATVSNGQKIILKIISANEYSTQSTATVTIGGLDISFDVMTKADPFVPDTTPDALNFGFKRDQQRSTLVSSSTINVTGINMNTPISIENGEYKIGDGSWTSIAGTLAKDSNVTVRHYSASDYYSETQTTLTVGGVEGVFSSFTAVEDTNPNVFEFVNKNSIEKSAVSVSDEIIISGINAPAPIFIVGGEYKVGSGSWTNTAGTINNNFPLTVRLTAANTFSTETKATVTVGNVVTDFVVTTKTNPGTPDTIPDSFKFEYEKDQNLSTEVESNMVTITGIASRYVNGEDVVVSIHNGSYSKNGAAFTDENGTVEAGDILIVKHTTSDTFDTKVETTLTVGGVSSTFKSFTKVEDKTPDLFNFETQTNVTAGSEVTSNEVTITGINVETPISVTNGTITNGVSTVSNGDTISIRQTASSTQGATTISELTVGTVKISFVTVTAVLAPTPIGTPLTTVAEDSEYSFTPSVDLSSGGKVERWTISNIPTWAEFNTITGQLSGTPSNEHVGTVSGIVIFAVNETDTVAMSAFNIVVTNTNDAPTMEVTPVTRVAQGAEFTSFTPVVTDADSGDTITYALTSAPDWMSINTATGEISGTRTLINSDVGNYSGIVITATDSAGESVTHTFSVEVINSNDAPVISGTPSTTAVEDTLYSFTPVVSDADVGDTKTFTIINKPSWALFDEVTGTLTGTPSNANVHEVNNVTITVTDGAGATDSLAFTISVQNVNDAPILSGLPVTLISEGGTYSFTPTFTDVDETPIPHYTMSGNPSWLSIDEDSGVLSGSASEVGVSNITITVTDGEGGSDTLSFMLTVENVNDAPVLTTISEQTIAEEAEASITLSSNDADVGDIVFYSVSVDSSQATAHINGSTLIVNPLTDVSGDITVTVSASDGMLSDSKTFIIHVTPVDDAPVLGELADIAIQEDQDRTVVLTATDIDSDSMSYTVVSSDESLVTVTVADSDLIITPQENQTGSAEITVTVTADGQSDSKTFMVTVIPVNDAPIAMDGTLTTLEEVNGVLDLRTLITNAEGVADISSIVVTEPSHGTTTVSAEGIVSYAPAENYAGSDSFTYTVTDLAEQSATGTIVITVTNVDDAPILTPIADVELAEDENTTIMLAVTDIDSDISSVVYSAVSADETVVTVSVIGATLKIMSAPNAIAATDINVTATLDGKSDSKLFNVQIMAQNDAPQLIMAEADKTTAEDTNLTITLVATDVDNPVDALTFSAVSLDPLLATASVNGNLLTISPVQDMFGALSVRVTVSDGEATDSKLINLTITPVNDAPVAIDTDVVTSEEMNVTVDLSTLVSDVEGNIATVEIVTPPTSGSLSALDGNRTTYSPNENFNGADSFTYRVTDSEGLSSSAVVNITVTAQNDLPIVGDLNVSLDEDANVTIDLHALITDTDGDVNSVLIKDHPTHGTLVPVTNGVIYYPIADFNGTDSFTFEVIDAVYTVVGTINLTVMQVNDAPTALDKNVTTTKEQNITIDFMPLVRDIEGNVDVDGITITTPPSSGMLTPAGTAVIYTPANGFVGHDSFVYRVTDTEGAFAEAEVNITVEEVAGAYESMIFPMALYDPEIREECDSGYCAKVYSYFMLSVSDVELIFNNYTLGGDGTFVSRTVEDRILYDNSWIVDSGSVITIETDNSFTLENEDATIGQRSIETLDGMDLSVEGLTHTVTMPAGSKKYNLEVVRNSNLYRLWEVFGDDKNGYASLSDFIVGQCGNRTLLTSDSNHALGIAFSGTDNGDGTYSCDGSATSGNISSVNNSNGTVLDIAFGSWVKTSLPTGEEMITLTLPEGFTEGHEQHMYTLYNGKVYEGEVELAGTETFSLYNEIAMNAIKAQMLNEQEEEQYSEVAGKTLFVVAEDKSSHAIVSYADDGSHTRMITFNSFVHDDTNVTQSFTMDNGVIMVENGDHDFNVTVVEENVDGQYHRINISLANGTIISKRAYFNQENAELFLGDDTNHAPVLEAISDQTFAEGEGTKVIELEATDADDNAITFEINSSDARQLRTHLNGTQLTLSVGTVVENPLTVTVTARDSEGATDTQTFEVSIPLSTEATVIASVLNDITLGGLQQASTNIEVSDALYNQITAQSLNFSPFYFISNSEDDSGLSSIEVEEMNVTGTRFIYRDVEYSNGSSVVNDTDSGDLNQRADGSFGIQPDDSAEEVEFKFSTDVDISILQNYFLQRDIELSLDQDNMAQYQAQLLFTKQLEDETDCGDECTQAGDTEAEIIFSEALKDAILAGMSDHGGSTSGSGFTREMLNTQHSVWEVSFEEDDNEWQGATFEFNLTHVKAQQGLAASVGTSQLDTTYAITENGELTFYIEDEDETAYLSIVASTDQNITICWSDTENSTCSAEDYEYLYFTQAAAQSALDAFNAENRFANRIVGTTQYFANSSGTKGDRTYNSDNTYTGTVILSDGSILNVSGTYSIEDNVLTISRTSPSEMTIILTYTGDSSGGMGFDASSGGGSSTSISFTSESDRDAYINSLNTFSSRIVGTTQYFANSSGTKGDRTYNSDNTYTGTVILSDGSILNVSGTYSIEDNVLTISRTSPSEMTIILTYTGDSSGGMGFDASSGGGSSTSISFTSEGDRDAYINSLNGGGGSNPQQNINIGFERDVESGSFDANSSGDYTTLPAQMYRLEYDSYDGLDIGKHVPSDAYLTIYDLNSSDSTLSSWIFDQSLEYSLSDGVMFFDPNEDGINEFKLKFVNVLDSTVLNSMANQAMFDSTAIGYHFMYQQLVYNIDFDNDYVKSADHTSDTYYHTLDEFITHQQGGSYFDAKKEDNTRGIAFATGSSGESGNLIEANNTGGITNDVGTWLINSEGILMVTPTIDGYDELAFRVVSVDGENRVERGEVQHVGDEEEFIWFNDAGKDNFLQYLHDNNLSLSGEESNTGQNNDTPTIEYTDTVSYQNLMWEDTAHTRDDTSLTWSAANNYCQALDLAGFDNWRLPHVDFENSINEVVAIRQAPSENAEGEVDNTSRTIIVPFEEVRQEEFKTTWTDAVAGENAHIAAIFQYNVGNADGFADSQALSVRCVRNIE